MHTQRVCVHVCVCGGGARQSQTRNGHKGEVTNLGADIRLMAVSVGQQAAKPHKRKHCAHETRVLGGVGGGHRF